MDRSIGALESNSADASEEHRAENKEDKEVEASSEQQQSLLLSTAQERQYLVQ
jgi:hypothetical protein